MKVIIGVFEGHTSIEIEGLPEVASDCSGADARAIGCGAISADPKRSGDSPVKVSDHYSWIDPLPEKDIYGGIAKILLQEVRRLEQLNTAH